MDTRFGHPDDWGLSPQRHSEIASELSDHLDCLQADEGSDAARAAEAKLAEPQVRKKISSAHVADQLTTTLLRWPTPAELREWMWLGFWIVLLAGGTAAWQYLERTAALFPYIPGERFGRYFSSEESSPIVFAAILLAWLLCEAGRIGVICQLVAILKRSSRIGIGVMAARAIQLSLWISIVQAVMFRNFLTAENTSQLRTNLAHQLPLTSEFFAISAGIVAILLLLMNRSRLWLVSSGLAMFALAAYFTGPGAVVHFQSKSKLSQKVLQEILDNGMDPQRVNLEEGWAILDGIASDVQVGHSLINAYSKKRESFGIDKAHLRPDMEIRKTWLTEPYIDVTGNFTVLTTIIMLLLTFASVILHGTKDASRSVKAGLHKMLAPTGAAFSLITCLVIFLRFPDAPFSPWSGNTSWTEFGTPFQYAVSSVLIHPFPQLTVALNTGSYSDNNYAIIVFMLVPLSLFMLMSAFMVDAGKSDSDANLVETT